MMVDSLSTRAKNFKGRVAEVILEIDYGVVFKVYCLRL